MEVAMASAGLCRPLPRPPAHAARRGTAFHAWLEERFGATGMLDIDSAEDAADLWVDEALDLGPMQEWFRSSRWAERTPAFVEAPVETTVGEFSSGAVGSSTTISRSVLDMGSTVWVATATIGIARRCNHRQCSLQLTGPFGKRARKRSTIRIEDAALGDQTRHQPRRRDVETEISDRGAIRNHAHGFDP